MASLCTLVEEEINKHQCIETDSKVTSSASTNFKKLPSPGGDAFSYASPEFEVYSRGSTDKGVKFYF